MPHPPVMDFLLTRRSRPAKLLSAPVPDRAGLDLLLTAAARVPDHGKLEPWRFIVLHKPALRRIAESVAARAAEREMAPEQAAKGRSQFDDSPLAVAVIASPKGFDRIPEIEQTLSAGAVCLSLVNAALAAGWGASWLTGWAAHDRALMADVLGLQPGEWVAGFVHIGTTDTAPAERPRPDIAAITTWISE
ncbi:Nitroreductase [Gemmobacter megaterium]|uniref:Putative NAD(P)H nitroreductase n=2 Tax=Gemmobacter megaterium TaxID=1086013 RepID=A0A1N7MGA7_9RHOB|nr:nitroreductase [Gemmobacter megaterium]SIS85156.1 Nitroreductase [Gemmobacter megaterium]